MPAPLRADTDSEFHQLIVPLTRQFPGWRPAHERQFSLGTMPARGFGTFLFALDGMPQGLSSKRSLADNWYLSDAP